jgi:plasmid stabilization system protein ParE
VTPRLVLRPQAETELLDARDWYEDQHPGLGGAFATEVERAVGGILQAPLAYPRVQGEIRRALLRRFPYAIYFRATPDEIVVLAVIHGRRHPQRWQSRR